MDKISNDWCRLSLTGLEIQRPPTLEEWQATGLALNEIREKLRLWVGDWINAGEFYFGEKYSQALDITGFEIQTLYNAAYVCKKVSQERRRPELSFSHYSEVASLAEPDQSELLGQAAAEGLTVLQLRSRVKSKQAAPGTDEEMQRNEALLQLDAAIKAAEIARKNFPPGISFLLGTAIDWLRLARDKLQNYAPDYERERAAVEKAEAPWLHEAEKSIP